MRGKINRLAEEGDARSVEPGPMAGGRHWRRQVKPILAAAAASTEAREEELVAAAQAGSKQAFEALFRRYRDRITTFVRSSVRDDGRTEDLVQEIFFSAHKNLGSLEHPGAFRSWIYQIARNACLDEARRRSRQDELILGWDEFPPPDERIVTHNQSAEGALSQKEELSNLTQALDGLPESQHEALVLREIGGMSYDEIGRRMQLSRPAVESVLFRARRGLKGEYSEISTGERCKRMQTVMDQVAQGMGDLGERRKLIRHMRDCAGCRRDAAALGLAGLAVPSDERSGLQRAFSRVAAFLPLPAFFRRAQDGEQLSASGGGSSVAMQAQNAATQLSTAVGGVGGDHAASVIHKAAAVVAAVAVVGGGGVAIEQAGVKLPVDLPSLTQTKKNEATTAPADPGKRTVPTVPATSGEHSPALSAPSSQAGAPADSAHPVTGEAAPAAPALAGTTPVATETPAGNTGAPATGTPDTSSPAPSAPSDGGSTGGSPKPKGDKGSSGTGTTGGSGGSAGGDSSGSGGAGGDGSGSGSGSGASGGDAGSGGNPAGLPPGIQKQLESGKRTLNQLPPGLAKKLARGSAAGLLAPQG
jgi:RNA polymerase sigma factor (sigma-70 family)